MQEKPKENLKFGLYVHVPFCANICDYCAFYHELPNKNSINEYLNTIAKEISDFQTSITANTIYWGGGTPGILSHEQILTLGGYLKNFIRPSLEEWTVELAPITVTKNKLLALKALGVNRISIGVQSFDEKILKILGRKQTNNIVFEAYDMIRDCGFENVGIDLMFSVPGQTICQWQNDLQAAIDLNPEHISTYNLTFEGDSKLVRKMLNGEIVATDEEKSREFFIFTWDFLGKAGYKQYEISNFSRNGFESKHNVNTWKMQEWIGFGPSASSQFKNRRFTNVSSTNMWRAGIESGVKNLVDVCDINDEILAVDSIIFGLRTCRGVNFKELKERFKIFDFSIFSQFIEQLVCERLANFDGDNLYLTTDGLLVADAIASEFIAQM